ncbi:MAG: carbohydrate kinase, partial [Chitinophagaceae bacterium]|nr:carbohydrate kinase [Chitinophagaceae bacterium]
MTIHLSPFTTHIMHKLPVITIFDIGKTNKKLLLFDEQYKLVYEESKQFDEIKDEDGFDGEDVGALTNWLKNSFVRLLDDKRFDIKALNFSGYGASLVYLNDKMEVFLPLYNYLKPYPPQLQKQFYDDYGGESLVARQTASPVLGHLNSGMQLYRLKYEKPLDFERIKHALHLPQYLGYIFSSKTTSDITSVGCHTNLWDFEQNEYHTWVKEEGIQSKLAPLMNCEAIAGYTTQGIPVGTGLHDSSAALIPYLAAAQEPFILLSTGTWCISLNPFNQLPLTDYELQHDCLCYLSYQGKPVKASRLFAGNEHEQQTKKLSAHFNKPLDFFATVQCNAGLLSKLKGNAGFQTNGHAVTMLQQSVFGERNLEGFASYEEAYHQLIADIIVQQLQSTQLVLSGTTV